MPPRWLLPPEALAASASPEGRRALRALAALAPPTTRAMTLLVARYQSALDAFATPEVAARTRALVARMYRAQLDILREGPRASEQALRDKCALPFVVMALPAWARAKGDEAERDAHLAWVERFGDLLGLVDDAADLAEDEAAGAPNRVARAREEPGAWVAARVEQARDVLRAPPGARHVFPDVSPRAPAACVAAWLASAQD